MRLILTCLRWEIAEQPPIVLNDVVELRTDGPYLYYRKENGEEGHITDLELTIRVTP